MNALMLTRKQPQNKYVGMVYQNAHEWVRVHMREIVIFYRDTEGIDLDSYLGLTPECYEDGVD